jgi:alanine racemase
MELKDDIKKGEKSVIDTIDGVNHAYTSISGYGPLQELQACSARFKNFLDAAEQQYAEFSTKPVLVGIDSNALRHNMACIGNNIHPRGICAVLKSDAYGHGIENVVPVINQDVACYAIADNHEAEAVYRLSRKPIYRLKTANFIEIADALTRELNIHEMIGSLHKAHEINQICRELDEKALVQIVLDCGYLGRNGFDVSCRQTLLNDIRILTRLPHLRISSITCHLPAPETCNRHDPQDPTISGARRFLDIGQSVQDVVQVEAGCRPLMHLLSSASCVALRDVLSVDELSRLDFDRIGTSLYGCQAADNAIEPGIRQVMHVMAFISDTLFRPTGANVGYCNHYSVSEPGGEYIALVGLGWQTTGREFRGEGDTDNPVFVVSASGDRHTLLGRQSMNTLTVRAKGEQGNCLSPGDPVFITTDGLVEKVLSQSIPDLAKIMGDVQNEYLTTMMGNSPSSARFSF